MEEKGLPPFETPLFRSRTLKFVEGAKACHAKRLRIKTEMHLSDV